MRRFLRTISFDDGDARLFPLAARSDEWAVSGAFAFGGIAPEALTVAEKSAFAVGFLGLGSFGRSTYAVVAEASDNDLAQLERRLAEHLSARYGAPSMALAFSAADEEIAHILRIAKDAPLGTVLRVRRSHDRNGCIAEEFQTVAPSGAAPPSAA